MTGLPPGTQHSCSPQLGSVAQPQRTGQNRCPVIHEGTACTVCAQCRPGRGIAHLCGIWVAAKPAAKAEAGEPIPAAPVEHVQLFKVKYSCEKKWHTEPVALSWGA